MEKRLFAIRGCIVTGGRCSSSVDEVVQVALPNQELKIRFVRSAAGREVAFLLMEGAVCSGVRMSLPKLICRLPEEGIIPDVPEEDVD